MGITLRELSEKLKNLLLFKSDIIDNLTTTEKGKTLDASQGKVLDDKINTLSENIQLKPNNWKTEADLPSSYPRGVSIFYSPSGTWNNYSYVMIRTTKNTDNSVFQEVLDAHRGEKLFFRGSDADNANWSTWKTVATIEGLPKHFYWELSELNMNNNSSLNDIFNAMVDKSELNCAIVNAGADIYPRAYGTLKITRITSLIGCAEFSFDKGNRRFIGDFRSVTTNLTEFSGWSEIAAVTKIDTLWVGSQSEGDIVLVNDITKYNAICVHSGVGNTYIRHVNDLYNSFFNASNPQTYLTVGGSAVLTPKDTKTFTITSTNQPIRRVEEIIHGIY